MIGIYVNIVSTGVDGRVRRGVDDTAVAVAHDMNDTNETLESYLLKTRGPKHLSLIIVVPITVIYVLLFVTGVVGNIAVCVVIVRNNFMHTATNYYLFSLAVSDLTLLLLGKFSVCVCVCI